MADKNGQLSDALGNNLSPSSNTDVVWIVQNGSITNQSLTTYLTSLENLVNTKQTKLVAGSAIELSEQTNTISVKPSSETQVGAIRIATTSEVNLGVSQVTAVNPYQLKTSIDQALTGAMIYKGTWDTTNQTDFSGIPLPVSVGYMFLCIGTGCTIDGTTFEPGDYIIIRSNIPEGGTIISADVDKVENTFNDVVRLNLQQTLTNKTIDAADNTIQNLTIVNFSSSSLAYTVRTPDTASNDLIPTELAVANAIKAQALPSQSSQVGFLNTNGTLASWKSIYFHLSGIYTANPPSPIEGDVYYNSLDKMLYTYQGGVWSAGVRPSLSIIYIDNQTGYIYEWFNNNLVQRGGSIGTTYTFTTGLTNSNNTISVTNPMPSPLNKVGFLNTTGSNANWRSIYYHIDQVTNSRPTNPTEGFKYYDLATKKIYTYQGGAWDLGVTPVVSIIYIDSDGASYEWTGTDLNQFGGKSSAVAIEKVQFTATIPTTTIPLLHKTTKENVLSVSIDNQGSMLEQFYSVSSDGLNIILVNALQVGETCRVVYFINTQVVEPTHFQSWSFMALDVQSVFTLPDTIQYGAQILSVNVGNTLLYRHTYMFDSTTNTLTMLGTPLLPGQTIEVVYTPNVEAYVVEQATTTNLGGAYIATSEEASAGIDTLKIMTPKLVKDQLSTISTNPLWDKIQLDYSLGTNSNEIGWLLEGDKTGLQNTAANQAITNALATGTEELQYGTANYGNLGCIIDNNYNVTSFTPFNTISTLKPFNPGNSSWEIQIKFTTGTSVSGLQEITGGLSSTDYKIPFLGIRSSKFSIALSSTGTSWNLSITQGTYTPLVNTTYWIKYGFSGTQYYVDYSLDGTTFIRDITLNLSTIIYQGADSIIGLGNHRYSPTQAEPFNGSISLLDTKITVGNEIWWEPYPNKFPFKLASNGMQIVDSQYKAQVDQLFNDTGSAPYYIRDAVDTTVWSPREVNREFVYSNTVNGITVRVARDGYCEQTGTIRMGIEAERAYISFVVPYKDTNYIALKNFLTEATTGAVWGYLSLCNKTPYTMSTLYSNSTVGEWKTTGYVSTDALKSLGIKPLFTYYNVGSKIIDPQVISAQGALAQISNLTNNKADKTLTENATIFNSVGRARLTLMNKPDYTKAFNIPSPYTALEDGYVYVYGSNGTAIDIDGMTEVLLGSSGYFAAPAELGKGSVVTLRSGSYLKFIPQRTI